MDRGAGVAAQAHPGLNRVLLQASAAPYREKGKTLGFRITRISAGSIYERIGLREGHLLLSANRRKRDDPAKLLDLYLTTRNKRSIFLVLSRHGLDRTFHYIIR